MKALGLLLLIALPLRAELTFEETEKEIRAGIDQREVICDFAFRNDGDAPVEIARYHANCSCMSVQIQGGKLRYEPGEKGLIRATFDIGNFTGEVVKSVQLWLSDDPARTPSITLNTKIHIPVLVEVEPKTVRWEVADVDKPKTRVVSIRMNGDKPIRVLSAESANNTFQIELKTLEEGSRYELRVTPTSLSTPALGVIQIRTDSDSQRHATQRAFALIRQPVSNNLR